MSRLTPLNPDSAQGAARDMLADLVDRHGSVGAMVSTMAHSPAVLGGYLQLSRAMRRAKLDRRVSERLSIAVQAVQGCQVCLRAHRDAAASLGVDPDEIARAHDATSADPAIAAVLAFGMRVYRSPSSITDADVDDLRAYGYRDREIADVVGVVALNVLTGAFNLVAGLRE
ncbi:Alkyl hydroperoxide reductase AhpD [Micromonospora sp. MW-13]|uniref:carboxymuconolactone decarboxylase family protein n=1 Tax=Micromonospora sp. MW-13 TaxID=2094022 RepID=UPI000E42DD26|nr:carboxymuconolactone decarboxylase family protein [Micromonospora sp. MW-13]RGC65359.1 Alkyl hydroperoxide reductase AhpD [Micromonospora sp. MW-13]